MKITIPDNRPREDRISLRMFGAKTMRRLACWLGLLMAIGIIAASARLYDWIAG